MEADTIALSKIQVEIGNSTLNEVKKFPGLIKETNQVFSSSIGKLSNSFSKSINLSGLTNNLGNIFNKLGSSLKSFGSTLKSKVANLSPIRAIGNIKNKFTNIKDNVKGKIATAKKAVKNFITGR